MDNIDIDVRNARALGLSYEQYKALSYDPNASPSKKKKEIICPVCGEIVKPPRTKFCSKECLLIRSKEINRLRSHERYHSKVKLMKEANQNADS